MTVLCLSITLLAAAGSSLPAETAKVSDRVPVGYRLGTGDMVQISILDIEGIDGKTYRIGGNGEINVPMIGAVKAANLTIQQLETDVTDRFRKYLRKPNVTVAVTEFRSQPVSVIGAVNTPGVQHLEGEKTLIEVLSGAGGLRQDAGPMLKITRKLSWGKLPLPNATDDPTGQYSIAEINLASVLSAENPDLNITMRSNDVVSVPKAEMVYVVGEVARAGGFPLSEREPITVLQALSLAGGLNTMAKAAQCRILRNTAGSGEREEIAVDVKAILQGRKKDVPLRGEDILFVPDSATKRVTLRSVEAAIQTITGIAVWRSAR